MAAGRRVQATGGVGAAAAGWRVSGRQRRTAPQAMARVGGEALPAVSCARRAPPLGVGGGWGAVVGGDLGKEAEGGGGVQIEVQTCGWWTALPPPQHHL